MDIIIGNTPKVKKDPEKKPHHYGEKERIKDRRKNKVDRRKSNREGIIVTLTNPDDRRVQPDRRRKY